MHLYFTVSQIPEMANLSDAQRHFVSERCVFWLFRRHLYQGGHYAVILCCMFSAIYLTDSWRWPGWKTAAFAALTTLIVHLLYNTIWIAHWRAEVRRFIQLHAAEIHTTA